MCQYYWLFIKLPFNIKRKPKNNKTFPNSKRFKHNTYRSFYLFAFLPIDCYPLKTEPFGNFNVRELKICLRFNFRKLFLS